MNQTEEINNQVIYDLAENNNMNEYAGGAYDNMYDLAS